MSDRSGTPSPSWSGAAEDETPPDDALEPARDTPELAVAALLPGASDDDDDAATGEDVLCGAEDDDDKGMMALEDAAAEVAPPLDGSRLVRLVLVELDEAWLLLAVPLPPTMDAVEVANTPLEELVPGTDATRHNPS